MGLLSDPSLSRRSKLGRNLAKHSNKICFVLYIAGLIWFGCLAHPSLNHGTYLSENALSPGLVYPETRQESSRLAQTFMEELQRERATRKSSTPLAWLVAKMSQIGLETHVHNFTLTLNGKEYYGKNVYGILRAPRIGSTEGIVFTAPYRAPSSIHEEITASVPVLLAFADFARKRNYWAKDLIFLVTEQEQLGMHAWLEAYFEGGIQNSDILNCGNLPARAGALQAALNLEIQDLDIEYINVKIEGLNGQLPNLDMFNLVQRITAREGISSGYKQTPHKKRKNTHSPIENNLKHIFSMLFSQASGVPNGNHGLFHRYRIESLTLEAIKRSSGSNYNQYSKHLTSLPLLKTIEGISRSLNNLLERFHQSYFFYILVQNDLFISIGDYTPSLGLMAGALLLKAFMLWLSIDNELEVEERSGMQANDKELLHLPFDKVLSYAAVVFGLGLLTYFLPLNTTLRLYISTGSGLQTAHVISLFLLVAAVCGFLLPMLTAFSAGGLEILHIGTLIFLGTTLIVVGLLNFAFGFLISIVTVPLAILISTPKTLNNTEEASARKNTFRRSVSSIYIVLLNPLIFVYIIVLVLTLSQFPELGSQELITRSITATMDAFTFASMDCIIFGNWLYAAVTAVLFPIWTLFWTLSLARCSAQVKQKQK